MRWGLLRVLTAPPPPKPAGALDLDSKVSMAAPPNAGWQAENCRCRRFVCWSSPPPPPPFCGFLLALGDICLRPKPAPAAAALRPQALCQGCPMGNEVVVVGACTHGAAAALPVRSSVGLPLRATGRSMPLFSVSKDRVIGLGAALSSASTSVL